MTSRLRMDVVSCIVAYQKLSRDIFKRKGWRYWGGVSNKPWDGVKGSPWFDSKDLEDAIVEVLEQRLPSDEMELTKASPREAPLLDSLEGNCKSLVCAVNADTLECALLRSYLVVDQQLNKDSFDCTIIDAVKATSAAPFGFPTAKIGTTEFFDVALENNNPTLEVINEVRRSLGNPHIQCLVSIGTGKSKLPNHRCRAFGGFAPLGYIPIDTEQQHQEIMTDSSYKNIRARYHRFNVEGGLIEIDPDRRDKIPEITRLTREYLLRHDVRTAISQCAQLLERG
ncbi:hypothetical protein GP486_002543 [Trichoglossum hirsutum]|uniref:PNPLA domain-containing protein n=1 Tax=Trichoglossum hirsutum TaxID=265104 RepID=A0A9P8LER2_9PEZI|nr:hypothetical protein GP486_002543 [Trichoglossum hirsutum]